MRAILHFAAGTFSTFRAQDSQASNQKGADKFSLYPVTESTASLLAIIAPVVASTAVAFAIGIVLVAAAVDDVDEKVVHRLLLPPPFRHSHYKPDPLTLNLYLRLFGRTIF